MAKFQRKNNNPDGIYYCAYKVGINDDTGNPEIKKTITIRGRDVYETDDRKEIEFLQKDPEVVEVVKK